MACLPESAYLMLVEWQGNSLEIQMEEWATTITFALAPQERPSSSPFFCFCCLRDICLHHFCCVRGGATQWLYCSALRLQARSPDPRHVD